MKNQLLPILIGLVLAVGILVSFLALYNPPVPARLNDVHFHADFKVFINGEAFDFTRSQYQSDENHVLNPAMHLHDGNGNILHKHQSDATIGDFFDSIGMQLSSRCLVLDNNDSYCNSGEQTLKMRVNEKPNYQFGDYSLNDLDRILISYGNESESQLTLQMDSVTDLACVNSNKCPDRGTPADESNCTVENGCVDYALSTQLS